MKVLIAGCGAVGSWLGILHANAEHEYILIDDDVVERENVFNGTSAYYEHHIGVPKVQILAEMIYLKSGADVIGLQKTVKAQADITKHNPDIVVDCFDNVASRALTIVLDIPSLHVGVGRGFGSIEWAEDFEWDKDKKTERNEQAICTNELGRNIILVTAAIAVNQLNTFLTVGHRESVVVKETPLGLYR
jgi:hypothetical protein